MGVLNEMTAASFILKTLRYLIVETDQCNIYMIKRILYQNHCVSICVYVFAIALEKKVRNKKIDGGGYFIRRRGNGPHAIRKNDWRRVNS